MDSDHTGIDLRPYFDGLATFLRSTDLPTLDPGSPYRKLGTVWKHAFPGELFEGLDYFTHRKFREELAQRPDLFMTGSDHNDADNYIWCLGETVPLLIHQSELSLLLAACYCRRSEIPISASSLAQVLGKEPAPLSLIPSSLSWLKRSEKRAGRSGYTYTLTIPASQPIWIQRTNRIRSGRASTLDAEFSASAFSTERYANLLEEVRQLDAQRDTKRKALARLLKAN